MYSFTLSPIGDISIEDLRIALINYVYARKAKSDFSLRIANIEKNEGDKEKEVIDILTLFGLRYRNISYQSNSIKFYQQFATKLLMQKRAFACFCTEDELEKKRKKANKNGKMYCYDGTCEKLSDNEVLNNENPFVVRVKKPKSDIAFYDEIKGELIFKPDQIDSFVILDTYKVPTDNFTCAIDDMLEDVEFAIKSERHLLDTPRQILIRKYLEYNKKIKYAHLPIILNKEGKEISKKDKISSVKWLLNEGFLPSAIANYLLTLGSETPLKVFELDDAKNWLDVKNLSKSPAIFDLEELKFLNREHIKTMDTQKLAAIFDYSSKNIGELIKFYTQYGSTIKEIKEKIDTIFALKTPSKDDEKDSFLLRDIIMEAPTFDKFEEFSEYLLQKSGFDKERLLELLGFLMTGCKSGPNLNELYIYLKDDIKEITRG